MEYEDRSRRVIDALADHGMDALVAIGGDGSLTIAHALFQKGLKVVGVPKTIDNDLAATNLTFGFQTAVETATDAIDKLHSTAQAHQRVMVIELMGRNAGWIALYSGVAGTADVILIPEIPYDMDRICAKIEARYHMGRRGFAMVVVAEGAYPKGGQPHFKRKAGGPDPPGRHRRGGGRRRSTSAPAGRPAPWCWATSSAAAGPTPTTGCSSLRFGAAAVNLVRDGCFGCMVALDPPNVLAVPLGLAIARIKTVPLDSDVMQTARSLGICLGD